MNYPQDKFVIANAFLQSGGIIGFQLTGLVEFMLIPAMLLFILIIVQTLSIAWIFQLKKLPEKRGQLVSNSVDILRGFLYITSSYQIYLIGYVFFAGVAIAHSMIYLLAAIMRTNKND